ncbi:MAG: 30S ribosomal protein S6 [Deltaproteobacteria bacterium]|nr:30S ribosomal protein S6 [Deltaproteobacteria bacterium]
MEAQKDSALYETLFILRPELGGKAKEFIDKFKKIVEDLHGTEVNVEEWGNRDLAYPIQKKSRGYYSLMQYRASAGIVEELERNMKLMEGVMRFLTVRLDEDLVTPSTETPEERPQRVETVPEGESSKAGPES